MAELSAVGSRAGRELLPIGHADPLLVKKNAGKMRYMTRTRSRGVVWGWHRADRLGGSICFAPDGVSVPYPLKTQDPAPLAVEAFRVR